MNLVKFGSHGSSYADYFFAVSINVGRPAGRPRFSIQKRIEFCDFYESNFHF